MSFAMRSPRKAQQSLWDHSESELGEAQDDLFSKLNTRCENSRRGSLKPDSLRKRVRTKQNKVVNMLFETTESLERERE